MRLSSRVQRPSRLPQTFLSSFALFTALTVIACGKSTPGASATTGEPPAKASAATIQAPAPSTGIAASAPSAPVNVPAPTKNIPVGKWSGTLEVRRHEMAMTKEDGAISAWRKDPGSAAAGKGTLDIQVANDGSITGTAAGPLGALTITGAGEDGRISLQLTGINGTASDGFSGYALLKPNGPVWTGPISASNGDSTLLREGTIHLKR